ncbi:MULTISPECIES: ABC transporter permease [unclassified Acinetobacter]|uniref:ABC transporter permease n=1 Tax=unclassified Acinetobacter TaxID=196816 RepID=UPI00244D025F|nr:MULTISPECIES: ABC transporter permease [unclassified Acinetobacter]MDH0030781.1 ABC transporter permease [Acinetobacter sp. GD04021]MDH0886446.1 ABC transporter permease [Acinetobacter sp. GD03873]MDH1082804.1 ABC transporter permease [Acinetobacter sp. GD03983]MDH2189830.1 ABC transporter permease [Acinetobacter sp. GD03645]MDH2202983.1 ABC transporter permease [Acinetobacter sp. GD03647]
MLSTIFKNKASTDQSTKSNGLWYLALNRLKADRIAVISFIVVLFYFIMLALSMTGVIASNWNKEVAVSYAPPTFLGAEAEQITATTETTAILPENPVDPLKDVIQQLNAEIQAEQHGSSAIDNYGIVDPLAADMQAIDQQLGGHLLDQQQQLKTTLPFGADKWGQDVLLKTIKGAETSILVGLLAALLAVVIGTFLGAIAGYFGGWVDDVLNWFYNIFTSIPYLLLVLAIAAVLQQKGILSIVLILGLTGWTGVFRLIRAEYMKHKSREYVLAAKAIGVSNSRRMFVHIFPNVSHIALVQISILVVSFIKSEVILSFLGFGVPVGVVSWGSMLNEAQSELILGKWWQLAAASIAMAVLVTAFSMFTDALRDALDPKLK